MRAKDHRQVVDARLARIERVLNQLAEEYLPQQRVRVVDRSAFAAWGSEVSDDLPEYEKVETAPRILERLGFSFREPS